MTENELIEVMARVLFSAEYADLRRPRPDVEPPWGSYKRHARAVLALFREQGLKVMERQPTRDMRRACHRDYMTNDKMELARLGWMDMWDVAPWVPGGKT